MLTYMMLLDTQEDKDKFSEIYLLYRERMYFVAYAILKNDMDAENIVHDAFIKIIDNLEKFNEIECHRTWNYIVTIVKHLSFNFLKKKKRYTNVPFEDYIQEELLDEEDIGLNIYRKNLEDALTQAVSSLPYPYKEVLYLQYYNELSSKEISEILGKTPESIRKIAERAKKKLERLLIERGFEE